MFTGSESGKCVGLPLSFFYPVGPPRGGAGNRKKSKEDKVSTETLEQESADFCHGQGIHSGTGKCKVLNACLEYAMVNESQGVLGGMTSSQRIKYRKEHSIEIRRPESAIMLDLAMN